MTSLVKQLLIRVLRERREPGRALEDSVALAGFTMIADKMANTGNTILKAATWMICLAISLVNFSTTEAALEDRIFGSGGYTKSGFRGRSHQTKGEDLHTDVSISFEEAAFGCDKKIRIQRGDGTTQTLEVHIPEGIEDGKSIRLKGKGMPGAGGGQPGDLFMKIHVGARPGFERKGADLYTTVQIPFATAALGGEVMVETLTGRVLCKIRKGTQSGSKIRLRGKGVARMNQPSVHGDQYVTVQIQVPDTLTPEAEQKLREFAAACQKGSQRGHSAA